MSTFLNKYNQMKEPEPILGQEAKRRGQSCCEYYLQPLLEKIDLLEGKLFKEIQRRQKEYNDIFHLLLLLKKNSKNPENFEEVGKKTSGKINLKTILHSAQNIKQIGSTVQHVKSSENLNFRKCSHNHGEKTHASKELDQKSFSSKNRGRSSEKVLELRVSNLQSASKGYNQQLQSLREEVSRIKNQNEQYLSLINTNSPSVKHLMNQVKSKEFISYETIPSIVMDHSDVHTQFTKNKLEERIGFVEKDLKEKINETIRKLGEHEKKIESLIVITKRIPNNSNPQQNPMMNTKGKKN